MNLSQHLLRDRRAHIAALAAIIVASAAARVSLFSGYAGLDDGEYARIAHRIATAAFSLQEYQGPPVFPLRLGVILPTALVFGVFGLAEWTMVVYPLVLSVLALVLAYFCTAMLFGPRAGLVAAALLGFTPMELSSATKLLPDMPAAFFAALGVTVIVFLERRTPERGATLFWGGCIAGASLGFSWLCKESITFLAPFCLAYMAISIRRSGRSAVLLWSGVAAGSLGVLFAETTAYLSVTGDPFFRFHEIERNYRELENGFFTEGSDFGWQKGESYARALAKRVLVSGPGLLLLDYAFLFLPLVGLIAALHGWYTKDKRFAIPSLWLVTLLVMFNFSSTSVSSYVPMALFHRYFYLIIFPSVVLSAGLIGKLLFQRDAGPDDAVRRERRFWGVALATALLLAGGYHLQSALRSSPSAWASEVRTLSSTIGPSTRLYTDTLSIRGFEFMRGYAGPAKWTDFADIASSDEIQPGSLVLVNRAYIEWLNRNGGMWLSPRAGYRKHAFYEKVPSSWQEVWRNGNARMYRVE
jgi:hypothetical protein